ncbi:MAG: hypothetical protein ACI8TQ_001296, partial [Planctomycetota bacterium]
MDANANAKSNGCDATEHRARQCSSSNIRSVSNGKPTYVNPDEPKLSTKSGNV